MRKLLSILCLFFGFVASAEDFVVFEKDGYFGIKDQTGNVTVPAVYETLGWSDGSSEVANGVIGFKQNRLWGLITVRNKPLTGQKFYSIVPVANGYFKASVKGKFNNYLFHGILDHRGKTIISFNHFTIEPVGANWLVSNFDGKQENFGIVSFNNEILVDSKYRSIEEKKGLFVSTRYNRKIDVFSPRGKILESGLDSLVENYGWVAYRDGYSGFLSYSGQRIHDITFKNILVSEKDTRAVRFPEWKIYENDTLQFRWECDSLSLAKNSMLIAYLNGANHLLVNKQTILGSHDLLLKDLTGNHLIVENSKTGEWSVLASDASQVFGGYDSIYSFNDYYLVRKTPKWDVINKNGIKQNRNSFTSIKKGISNQVVVERNGYWGIVNPNLEKITSLKYDSIEIGNDNYLVSYLNRWGVMTDMGEWVVRPEFAEVSSYGDLIVGRRGKGYSIFHQGTLVYKTTDKPLGLIGKLLLVQNDSNFYGLYSEYGFPVSSTTYNDIRQVGSNYVLKLRGSVRVINERGSEILGLNDRYESVEAYGEGYFLVKKENRWGFVDEQGRLRVSNRYDSALVFNENRSSVLLRSKWGFIDTDEKLKIQPYYSEASSFKNGIAIVRQERKYGLIDLNGKEVLELIWKSIRRLRSGNYIVQDMNDQVGLANDKGVFIVRPAYDDLRDLGDRILVSKNKKWGVLEYSGKPIFKINHEEIKVLENHTFVKN